MVFYNAFIFAGVAAVTLTALYFLTPKRADKWIAAGAVAAALVAIVLFVNRGDAALGAYADLMSCSSMTVTTEAGTKAVSLSYGSGLVEGLEEPPVYVKEKDVTQVAILQLGHTELRLCELTDPSAVPASVQITREGKAYVLLCTAFPYANACYRFPAAYTGQLVEAALN